MSFWRYPKCILAFAIRYYSKVERRAWRLIQWHPQEILFGKPARLALPLFPGTFWSRGRTVVPGISLFGEKSRRKLVAKITAACTWDSTLSVNPRFVTSGEDRNKDRFINWQLCGVWKIPFCDHGTINSSNAVFVLPIPVQTPCSAFLHS